jgi:DNA-binding transcriptional ArsR family regulator
MARPKADDEKDRVLLEYSEGIARLMKAAAHPARVKILALMLRGEKTFSGMMERTGLSKTALANHLSLLLSAGLVKKAARGTYGLTVDGRELLGTASTTYRNSARRIDDERALMQRHYRRAFKGGIDMERKVVSKNVKYQPCWLSYTGAMAGALHAMGVQCDPTDVGGVSGYAFLVNVSKGETCPSGPTALDPRTFKRILKATENLGWTIEHFEHPRSYPAKDGDPTPEELELVRKLYEDIKREIDERDRPVVLWGLATPEYGLVKGYEGGSYIVSTFRGLSGNMKEETPVPFHDLKAPGCIDALYLREKTKKTDTPDEILRRAIAFAEGEVDLQPRYVAGPEAFDEWARVLEEVPEERQNYMGNSYMAGCVGNGRQMSSTYLSRLSKKFPEKGASHLREASAAYAKGAKLMEEFSSIFPFAFQGQMTKSDRKRGAEILRRIKPLEKQAIDLMKKSTA